MPMYEYKCPSCGAKFEALRRMSEADEPAKCPNCGYQRAERQLSTCAVGGCGGRGGFT